jgi:hypothetical protein
MRRRTHMQSRRRRGTGEGRRRCRTPRRWRAYRNRHEIQLVVAGRCAILWHRRLVASVETHVLREVMALW